MPPGFLKPIEKRSPSLHLGVFFMDEVSVNKTAIESSETKMVDILPVAFPANELLENKKRINMIGIFFMISPLFLSVHNYE